MADVKPDLLCKILSKSTWEKSQGQDRVGSSPMDEDSGFVHFSTKDQVFKTLQKFYPGEEKVVLLINPEKLEGDLRFETNPGGVNQYYHLYDGYIPMESVVSHYEMKFIA